MVNLLKQLLTGNLNRVFRDGQSISGIKFLTILSEMWNNKPCSVKNSEFPIRDFLSSLVLKTYYFQKQSLEAFCIKRGS